jgi:putative ABC transport system permease protein
MDWRDGLESMDQVGAIVPISVVVLKDGEAIRPDAARMSADFLSMLRVKPFLGRPFTEEEYRTGESAAMLSYGLWQRWGGDPDLVGRALPTVGGENLVIVGVLPKEFEAPAAARMEQNTGLWLPLPVDSAAYETSRTSRALRVIGRLTPGVTVQQARREAETLGASLATAFPKAYMKTESAHLTIGVASLREQTVGRTGDAVLILLGATGFLLLIAVANIANLLIAEAGSREHEIALRSALGAGRRRMLEQLLTESVLLGLFGGAVGTALAWLLVKVFRNLGSGDLPRLAEVAIDQRALWFAVGASLLTGVLFGLAPALINSRVQPSNVIRRGGRNSVGGAGKSRLRRFLIVIETALAVVLLSGAGLLAASWVNLQSVDPGFEIAGVQAVEVGVADALPEPDSRIGYFERLLAEAESVPGVESVSIVSTLPLNGYTVWSPGIFRGSADSTPVAGLDCLVTGPGYFETMGIQIISGRGFTAREDISGGGLAVISEKAAQRMWPGEAPLGRQFFLGSPENPPITVVGVVADVHTIGLASDPFGAVYLAHSQVPSPPFMYLVVRSARGGRDLGVELKSIMQRLNSKIPFEGLVSLRDRVSDSVNRPRFNALLLVLFAGTALLLAAVGVSATLLNSVTQRTREIGVRVALGATSSKVLQMVIREGLILTGLGLAIGLAGTYALSRLLASFLFGVSATDPLILAAVCTALGAVAAVACYLPARHAMRMDPVHALRAE